METGELPSEIFLLKNNPHPNGNRGVATRGRHDGLCEYVSRSARSRLITLLVKKFGSRGLARALGVTHAAVNKWLRSGDTHPSNINLQKIVELAVQLNGVKTLKILKSDLSTHQNMLESFASRC